MAGSDMPKRLPAADGGKRYPLNMRTTEAMRLQLEAESKASGRSLAQEVEYCVGQYYGIKDELEFMRKPIVQMFALALKQAELNSGQSWHKDEVTAQKFRNSVISIVDLLFPFKPLSNLLARQGRVDSALDLLDAAELASNSVRGLDDAEARMVLDRVKAFTSHLTEALGEEQRARGSSGEQAE